jgi:hypothetical protein
MKPSEALDKAAEIIERDGWTQGVYYLEPAPTGDYEENIRRDEEARRSAPCCQRGAIVRALAGTWKALFALSKGERDTVRTAHGFCREVTGGHPVEWNDAPGRTKEEVIDMLKSAASLARKAGE